ncbi:MAG: amidase [Proteobacteria bacterium]|nr:amidase [Pseudomonadota bacterium]
MPDLPEDPFEPGGLAGFGRRLRAGETTVEAATEAHLKRIAALDPRLGAFEHVAAEGALRTARALDRLLASGTDLGPLMGVTVALKDLIAVEGMPTTAGSRVAVADLIGGEGSFVKALRRAGCVILGKTRTVEFARGAAGINRVRGTPVNPWDARAHRIPGGSSSGAAVAAAAGLAGLNVGTDTGGSVRGPAAFCGVFGLKTSKGLWGIDGIFPNAPSFDTVGLLTSSAADAALAFAALTGGPPPRPARLAGLKFGRPVNHFFDGLDPVVAECTEATIARLAAAGAEILPVDVPEAGERLDFLRLCAAEFLASLGRERFLAERERMEPLTVARALPALEMKADEALRVLNRHRELVALYRERMAGFDAWIGPTATLVAPTLAEVADVEKGLALEARLGVNTHLVSFFGLSATTTPIQGRGAALPVGLQVICAGGEDRRALAVALAVEALVGPPPRPNLSGFLVA